MAALDELEAAAELVADDAALLAPEAAALVAEAAPEEADEAPPATAPPVLDAVDEAVMEPEAEDDDEELASDAFAEPQVTDWQAVWPTRSFG